MVESTSNVEFANKVMEHAHLRPSQAKFRTKWVEIAEAVVLAIVATSTAWSGYQAAKWDALSAQNYNLASRSTVLSQEKATLAGQDRLYDITTFNGWVLAKTSGNEKLAAYFQRRFRPEYAMPHSRPGRHSIHLTIFQPPSVRSSCRSTAMQTGKNLQTSLRRRKPITTMR